MKWIISWMIGILFMGIVYAVFGLGAFIFAWFIGTILQQIGNWMILSGRFYVDEDGLVRMK